jgi:VCBS repeat-containing protein
LTYTVEVEDSQGATDTQDVTITITGTNDGPVAVADTAAVSEDGTDQSGYDDGSTDTTVISGDVFENDSDVDDGDTFSVTGVAAGTPTSADGSVASDVTGTYGTVSISADGSYTYDLDNTNGDVQALAVGETLTDTFTYTITDSKGATSTTTLIVTVNGTNDTPDITVEGTDSAAEGVTETDTTLTAGGTLTLSDVDTSDTVTTSVVNSVTTGGSYTGPVPDSADLVDMFTASGDLDGTEQSEANGITWSFDSGSESFDEIPAGETLTLTYTVEVEDSQGATDTQDVTITITGTNDGPVAVADTATATEDTTLTGNVLENDSDPDHAATLEVTGFSVDGDGTDYDPGNTATIAEVGTLTIGIDGAYTFVPNADYSGPVPNVTYMVSDGTVSDTATLDITGVTPVSDAPGLTVDDTTVSTNEDTSVALGLNAPTVSDATDDNGAGTVGDNPELLGPITLSGIPPGAQLLDGADSNAVLVTSDGSPITIVLSDGSYVSGATGDLTLTKVQYESLLVNPPADSGNDFTVTVSVTEYEVTDAGTQISGVPGATSTETINVDVQAVTDGVDLKIDGSDDSYDLTIDEDSSYDIASLLQANLLDTEGNGPDTDGSETRVLVFENLPEGATVNGQEIGADGSSIISLPGNDGTLPTINFTPPPDFSGDLEGIRVTLQSTDSDGDSSGVIDTLSDTVTLNLYVNPVAGDVDVQDVSTPEDTGVNFLADLDVTDTDGSEEITGITINDVPDGWVISDENGNVVLTGNGNDDLTIDSDDISSEAYKNYTITPPAHSSADETLSIDVETTDTQTVNGTTQTSLTMVNLSPDVEVTSVAEVVGGDSDGDSIYDLAINGSFTYTTAGQEDEWFSLDGTDGFDLDGPWVNQDADGSEETFALLSGVPEGSQFRFSTDGGNSFQVLTSDGTNPVEVPVEYLYTLQFRAPEEDDGTFNITVQAKTVDTDPDNGAAHTSISGNATLTLDIDPVPDDVTLAVSSPARGVEDNPIPLDIRPTSTDDDESFTVKINDIPDGAVINYDGNELTVTGGSVTIDNFDPAADLFITPPEDSNEDFALEVQSKSIEGTDESGFTTLNTTVKVAGEADPADITTVTPNEAELTVDSNGGAISLDSVITTANLTDTDGSETLNITFTGLDEQFDINGATFVGGAGTERVWVLNSTDLSGVTLEVPENYSGTVNFKARPVTTENDGDSWTGSNLDLSVEVTPSPEAVIETSTTVDEDTLGQVDFSIIQQNGETDETLSSVWISQADVEIADQGYTLYFGNGVSTTLQDAAGSEPNVTLEDGYYKLTGDAIDNIYVQGDPDEGGSYELDIKYEITDPSSDGTLSSVTEQFDTIYTVNVNAVTDPVEIDLGTITTTGNTAVSGTNVTANGNTIISVPFDILQVNDATENNGPDVDGSETAVRLVIDGVPEGVTVVGGTYIGDSSDTEGGVNTSRWLMNLGENFVGGGISQTLEFDLDGSTEQLAGLAQDITITVESQDNGSFIETGSATWNLSTPDFVSVSPATDSAAEIDTWVSTDADVQEDTPVSLGDLVNGSISVDTGDTGDFSITLTGLPEGAVVSGAEEFNIDGQTLYTVSGNGSAELQNVLAGVSITAPENSNSNNSGDLSFDATLTTWGPGAEENVQTVTINETVEPITDPAVVNIEVNNGAEDGMVPITVTVNNPADDEFGSVVDDTLYLRVGDTDLGGAGSLSLDGNPLTVTSITGDPDIPDGDYYVIFDVANGDTLNFEYQPTENASGTVNVDAFVESQESGASNVEITSENTSFEVTPVNDGYDLTVDSATGVEDTLVEIDVSGTGLMDVDGSEQVISAIVENLPDGYLVFTGTSSDTAVLASNIGDDGSGNNTWSIPLENGGLPDFIGVQAPENISGTVSGLALTVLYGEDEISQLEESTATFDLKITGVADGISALTPSLSFGDEGDLVPLNLNATLEDADGSETVNLTIQGAGEFAAFYDGSDNLLGADYDEGTDTYSISGLSVDDVNDLSILQTAREESITVNMKTVENDNVDTSGTESATFELDINPVDTTSGDDVILFDDTRSYDGQEGSDTLQLRLGDDLDFGNDPDLLNIEVLDLETSGGDHEVSNIALQDVLDITDGDNELFITGDSGDTVSLLEGTESNVNDQWSQNGTVTVTDFNGTGEDITFDIYVNNFDPSVTVNVEQDINDLII